MKLFPHIAIAAFTVATLTVTSAPAEARNRHAPRFAIGPKKAPSFHWSGRRAQRDKNRRVTTSAKLIAIHSEQKLSKAKRAIDASLVRLSPQQRGVIDTNVHYSINIIRATVQSATADGAVSSSEMLQIRLTSQAVANDLRKAYGDIAPWHLLHH